MLKITEQARAKVLEFIRAEEDQELALRVAISQSGEFEFGLVRKDDRGDDDVVIDEGGLEVYVDPESAKRLETATFEFVDAGAESGFRVVGAGPSWDDPVARRVQEIIDSRINPGVAAHGGHVTLLDVKGGRAFVKLGGGCQGCGMANVTLKHGIEAMIRDTVPEITEVIDTTDHAGGSNPYYSPAKGAGPSPFA
jgi:Fe/S biogenesis protein NfuA